MNALEKTLLIKELNDLLNYLDNRSLNLFEIAKSKNRIKEIFSLFDEPIFQKQQREFKLRLNPKEVSAEFAQKSLYSLSFLGCFQTEEELRAQHLSDWRSIGWAFLHAPQRGWQICIYTPQKDKTWHSSWSSLEQCYMQMLQQQAQHGLLPDSELLSSNTALQNITPAPQEEHAPDADSISGIQPAEAQLPDASEDAEPRSDETMHAEAPEAPAELQDTPQAAEAPQDNHSAISETPLPLIAEIQTEFLTPAYAAPQPEAASPLLTLTSDAILHTDIFEFSPEPVERAAPMLLADTALQSDNDAAAPPEILEAATETEPPPIESLALYKLKADVAILPNESAKDETLCALSLLSMPEVSQHTALLMPLAAADHWQQHPAMLAELLSPQGMFKQYAVLFGAQEQGQAMRLLNQYCRHSGLNLAAIKQISTASLGMDFTDADLLFNAYQQRAKLFWSRENYYPFIPSSQLHTQKFIQFDEPQADQNTPILLLQERHKIRVIHGQNRIALNTSEMSYPYLMLHRQHSITWQRIHAAIMELPQPVDVIALYHALTGDDAD